MRTILSTGLVAALAAAALLASRGVAAPTPEQIKSIQSAEVAMARAAKAFSAREYKEAGDAVKEAQKHVSDLKDARDVQKQLARILPRLKKAHALLELEGVNLPPLELPEPADRKADGKAAAKKGDKVDKTKGID